jgi:hypothetical protein
MWKEVFSRMWVWWRENPSRAATSSPLQIGSFGVERLGTDSLIYLSKTFSSSNAFTLMTKYETQFSADKASKHSSYAIGRVISINGLSRSVTKEKAKLWNMNNDNFMMPRILKIDFWCCSTEDAQRWDEEFSNLLRRDMNTKWASEDETTSSLCC